MFIFTILSSVFGGFFSFIKGLFTDLIDHPKTALVIVVLLAGLFGAYEIDSKFRAKDTEIATLQAANTTLTEQNTQLKADVASAVAVNKQDQVVINQLSLAKTDTEARVKELEAAQATNKTKTNALRQLIATSKPEDDGQVSNVLMQTLKAIQHNREAAQ